MFVLFSNAHDISVKRFASIIMLHVDEGSVFSVSESQFNANQPNMMIELKKNYLVLDFFKIYLFSDFLHRELNFFE